MRDFLLNSEDLLDDRATQFLQAKGMQYGLFPIFWIHYNERVKLACFPEGVHTLTEQLPRMDLNRACAVGSAMLDRILALQDCQDISLENVIWDPDSIYLDESDRVYMICLPARIPDDTRTSAIYLKRVYALIEDMAADKEGGDFVCRQIDFQKERSFGDWAALQQALGQRAGDEAEVEGIRLRGVNTPQPMLFAVGRDKFIVGSDPGDADGCIEGTETVSPEHAVIGWNDISYYVEDLESESGTFVNDQRIAPHLQIPIGQGTVLKFGDCTFAVE